MAISEHETGSKTTDGTEQTLNTTSPETTDGVYQLVIDVANLVSGDTLVIKVKEKARTGDTQRLLWQWTLVNAQTEKLWASPAIILMNGWDMTVTRSAGSDHAYPWSIRKIA